MSDQKDGHSIAQLATQITKEVIAAITAHSKSVDKGDKGPLEARINTLLRKHFDKLGSKDDPRRTQLRKALALKLHHDKLRQTASDTLDYLESLGAEGPGIPFKCIQDCQTGPGMVSQISTSPTQWIQRVFGSLQRIIALKTQLSDRFPEEKKREITENQRRFKYNISYDLNQLERRHKVIYQYNSSLSQEQNWAAKAQAILNQLPTNPGAEEDRQTLNQIKDFLALSPEELEARINAQVESIKSAAQFQLDHEKAELSHMAPGLLFVLSMGEDLDRYVQPLRFLGNLVMWPLNLALIIVFLVSLIPGMVLGALRSFLGFWTNLLTFGAYNKRVDAYQDSQVPQAFSAAMDAMRQQHPKLAEMSDDEVWQALLPTLQSLPPALGGCNSEAEYKRRLKDTILVGPLTFLKCSFGALWDSLTQMPKSAGWAFLWVLTWIPRLALGLVLGVVGTALTLARTIVDNVLVLGSLFLAFTVRTLTLLALNLPLYLLVDLPRAIGRLCCGEERKPVKEPRAEQRPAHSSGMTRRGRQSNNEEEEASYSYSQPLSKTKGKGRTGSSSSISTTEQGSRSHKSPSPVPNSESEVD